MRLRLPHQFVCSFCSQAQQGYSKRCRLIFMRFLEGVEKEQSLILCVILIRIQAFFEIPVCCNLVSCVTHNDNLS